MAGLSSEDKKQLGRRKAGKATAAKMGPDYFKEIGSKGGKSSVNNNPDMKTSEWGRRLVGARELRRYVDVMPAKSFADELERTCPPLGRVFMRLPVEMSKVCETCQMMPFEEDCTLRMFIQLRERTDIEWLRDARQTLRVLRRLLGDREALRLAQEEFQQQKTSPA